MIYYMICTWMVVINLTSFEARASEFTHIKLNPQFEEYLTQPKLKSQGLAVRSAKQKSNSASQVFSQAIQSTLLGNNSSPFPSDGEESPLYQTVREHLEVAHNEIGLREITQLDFINRQFNLGTQNFSGFSWQKPYGVAHVHADRQVMPNLFGNNWLIHDTFTFDIEATTFLEKANEAGLTDMSVTEIGAFAGITFKRVYTYYHYADSYQDGLKADFSKLFLPFVRFNQSGVRKMLDEEIMKREDNWSASAGGLITTPPLYNVSFSAGVLAEFAFQQMVSVQNNKVQNENEEKYRLSLKSKKSSSVGATLSLQLDFFKLIKFTLLNADLTYEYADAKEFTLGLSSSAWSQAIENQEQCSELKKILSGFGRIKTLEPYVVRLDETGSSSLESRASVLLWGKLQKNKTEQVRVIKDESVRIFYKNYSQSLKVVQNFFSRILSSVVYKVFKFPLGTKNAALYSKQVTMEYEATHPQASNPKVARIDKTEQFSFVMTQSYEAARTHRWIDKAYKNDLIWFVDSFTTLPKDYRTIIRQELLRGPMVIESTLRVEKAGLDYFLSASPDEMFGYMAMVCGSRRVDQWKKPKKRDNFLKLMQVGAESCVKKMGLKYISFKQDYSLNGFKPSLAKFKDFMTSYYKRVENLNDLKKVFGEGNTFINGQLQATTSSGAPFQTSFSSGQFRGLGVIDNFKRENGSRTPASIVSE